MMRTPLLLRACAALAGALLGLTLAVAADFEVTGPDGRRILLRENGTWSYIETPKEAGDKPKEKPKPAGEAVLVIERRIDAGGGCVFGLRLVNSFPYPINSIVPTFSAVRANDVVYDSVLSGFQGLKPGDSQSREILFRGIACQDIARLQVSGGERCVMGDLDRFSFDDGECLRRVRVVPSSLVRFDK